MGRLCGWHLSVIILKKENRRFGVNLSAEKIPSQAAVWASPWKCMQNAEHGGKLKSVNLAG